MNVFRKAIVAIALIVGIGAAHAQVQAPTYSFQR